MRCDMSLHDLISVAIAAVVLDAHQIVERELSQVELEVRVVTLYVNENGHVHRRHDERTADLVGGIHVPGHLQQHLQLLGP